MDVLFDAYLISLTFTQEQREALAVQGVTSLQVMGTLTTDDVHDMCTVIRKQTRVDPNNELIRRPAVHMPVSLEHLLKFLAYHLRHLQRTQRIFNAQEAQVDNLLAVQRMMEWEKTEKEKKYPEVNKLESVSKIRSKIESVDAYLRHVLGASGVPLAYVTRENVVPVDDTDVYTTVVAEMIDRAPHSEPYYEEDNHAVWVVLRHVMFDTDGWSWISDFEAAEDGRGAYQAIKLHYLGTTSQSRIKSVAERNIDSTFYDGEKQNFTLEKFCQIHKQAHKDLADYGEAMSENKKVRKFLQGIRAPKLDVAKSTVLALPHYNQDFDECVNFVTQSAAENGLTIRRTVSTVAVRGGKGGRCRFGGGYGHGGRGSRWNVKGSNGGLKNHPGRGGSFRGRGRGRGGRGGQGRGKGETGYYTQEEWNAMSSER